MIDAMERKLKMHLILVLLCFVFSASLHAQAPHPWPVKTLRGANINVDITEQDIAHYARDWKANSVRILINDITAEAPPYLPGEQTKKKVFDCIDLCLRYGLYTIFSCSASFENNDKFFGSEGWKTRYAEFWKELARRYSGKGGIAYDLMNEPHDSLARSQWSEYATVLTRAIREIDSVHTIVVEPPDWGWPNGFANLKPTGDRNTVYSFHFYGPMDYTHQRNNGHMRTTEKQWRERVYPGQLEGEYWDKARLNSIVRKAVEFRDRYNVKIWCGEFGAARWAMGADRWVTDFIDVLEKEKIGWAYYAYRDWYPMDMEMDPAARNERTPRSETTFVKLFRSYFALEN